MYALIFAICIAINYNNTNNGPKAYQIDKTTNKSQSKGMNTKGNICCDARDYRPTLGEIMWF